MSRIIPTFFLLIGFATSATPSKAEVSSANQREAALAFQALDNLVRETRAKGELPRLSNDSHAKILYRLWSLETTLGASPYSAADVPALLTIAEKSGAVFKTYIMFSPKNGTLPDTAVNTFKYQDEVTRAGAYSLHVYGAGLEAISDFVATLPPGQMNEARRAGLLQMRLGIMEQVTGLTLMMRSPDLRPENRQLLLDSLHTNADQIITATPIADRKAMAAQLDAIALALPDSERKKALALKSEFARHDCVALCAIN